MFTTYLSILGIQFLALASPGPDFALVSKNTLTISRRIGIYSALGIATGIILHVTYAITGIGLLLKNSPKLFMILSYLAGLYLLYLSFLSWKAFMKKSSEEKTQFQRGKEISEKNAFKMGFITNALNPKATLYFVSIFTQLLAGQNFFFQLICGMTAVLQTALWFSLMAYFLSQPFFAKKLLFSQRIVELLMGVTFLFLGIKSFYN